MSKPERQQYGESAEAAALAYLQQQGLTLLTNNYRIRQGEIDLIMLEGEVIVFVEVRARRNSQFIQAVETIDKHKQQRLLLTSQHFLQTRRDLQKRNCRFDVIAINGAVSNNNINWIKNAFTQ